MEETAAPAPAPVARTIGERLRAGRERAGLSVAASAEKLHLDPKVIEALEADRFAELGASVYVRGHLRRYADFVGEAGARAGRVLHRARSASAAARSHAGAAPGAPLGSAPPRDAAGRPVVRRGAGARHLVDPGRARSRSRAPATSRRGAHRAVASPGRITQLAGQPAHPSTHGASPASATAGSAPAPATSAAGRRSARKTPRRRARRA